MSALLRRHKACNACADSKRKCDRQLPDCQRCLDRDEECVYPQRKRRRGCQGVRHNQTEEVPAVDDLEANLDFERWATLGNSEIDISLLDGLVPYIPTMPLLDSIGDQRSTQTDLTENNITSRLPRTWFLQDETWILQHVSERPECVTDMEQSNFIRAVDEMLKGWVKEGHNSFIHQRLYDNGMPTHLQDAFTTLAAYTAATPAVKQTILQIAEERSIVLAVQLPPSDTDRVAVSAHLSRVQALFVYVFIRLFDGSVRLRVSAEQQIPTLRLWAVQMWEAAKQYQGAGALVDLELHQWISNDFDTEYNTASSLWMLWILTESIRRTHILVSTICNVYQTMTKGWSECTGGGMFTARRGLWDAGSAVRWLELSCTNSPLMVPSLRAQTLISCCKADEVDDFVKLLWTFLVGKDTIQCWIDKGVKSS